MLYYYATISCLPNSGSVNVGAVSFNFVVAEVVGINKIKYFIESNRREIPIIFQNVDYLWVPAFF